MNGRLNRDEEELNKKKILELVNEYNAFKRGNVRHFKFNAHASLTAKNETSLTDADGCVHLVKVTLAQKNNRIATTPPTQSTAAVSFSHHQP